MEEISEKMGPNQFAKVGVSCLDCGKRFYISLERTSPTEIKILNGAIGINKKTGVHLFKCEGCKDNPNWGTPCDVYSRVVGYLRPTRDWNDAKQREFEKRVPYKVNKDDFIPKEKEGEPDGTL